MTARLVCSGVVIAALAGCTSTTTVTVELANDPPTFIAYRSGSSAWHTPTAVTGGTYAAHHYNLDVGDDYEVVVAEALAFAGGFNEVFSYELEATSADDTRWFLERTGAVDVKLAPPGPPASVAIQGQCWFPGETQPTFPIQ